MKHVKLALFMCAVLIPDQRDQIWKGKVEHYL